MSEPKEGASRLAGRNQPRNRAMMKTPDF